MPFARSAEANLYFEVTGSGYPLLFLHEFAADHREWEAQVRFFSRRYRCVTVNARGYPPSDVPDDVALYDHVHQAEDAAAVMRHLGLARAHVVGLSMGAYATLQFGLRFPDMASALVVAGCGSGAPRAIRAQFAAEVEALAAQIETEGMTVAARSIALGSTRVQLQNKDPRGWEEFARHLSEHSSKGSALTLRGYQAPRPSLFDFEAELRRLDVPTLLVVGDEDEPCLETNLFLKRTIKRAGLWVVPNTGHAVNLEEPGAFNGAVADFLAAVERGRWPERDPRSLDGRALPTGGANERGN